MYFSTWQLVKESQALHVRSEMAALAIEAKALMDVDPWLAPEPPHPPGGTRLPHLFGALAHERMHDLVRFRWSRVMATNRLIRKYISSMEKSFDVSFDSL